MLRALTLFRFAPMPLLNNFGQIDLCILDNFLNGLAGAFEQKLRLHDQSLQSSMTSHIHAFEFVKIAFVTYLAMTKIELSKLVQNK